MKQKSHSGLKKRLKIRKSCSVRFDKAGKKHLLSNKSKRAKKSFPSGLPVTHAFLYPIRKMLPGKIRLSSVYRKERKALAAKQKANAAKKPAKA